MEKIDAQSPHLQVIPDMRLNSGKIENVAGKVKRLVASLSLTAAEFYARRRMLTQPFLTNTIDARQEKPQRDTPAETDGNRRSTIRRSLSSWSQARKQTTTL